MGYTAFSVTFGEVPTDAKWNYLGENDESFNDGTGIADDAIIQRHFADSSVGVPNLTDPNLAYKELGRDTLDASGNLLEVIFTPKKYLMVIAAFVANASLTNGNFKFNSDTGTNYGQLFSSNFAATASLVPSVAGFAQEVGNVIADGAELTILHIYNPSGADKIGRVDTTHQTALTAATMPASSRIAVMWNNTSQVNSIRLNFDQNVKAGADLIVLGHD